MKLDLRLNIPCHAVALAKDGWTLGVQILPGGNLNIQPKIGLHAHPKRGPRHRFRCDRENLSHLDIGNSLLAVGYSISSGR